VTATLNPFLASRDGAFSAIVSFLPTASPAGPAAADLALICRVSADRFAAGRAAADPTLTYRAGADRLAVGRAAADPTLTCWAWADRLAAGRVLVRWTSAGQAAAAAAFWSMVCAVAREFLAPVSRDRDLAFLGRCSCVLCSESFALP